MSRLARCRSHRVGLRTEQYNAAGVSPAAFFLVFYGHAGDHNARSRRMLGSLAICTATLHRDVVGAHRDRSRSAARYCEPHRNRYRGNRHHLTGAHHRARCRGWTFRRYAGHTDRAVAFLMIGLPLSTWYRLVIWLGLGLVIYFAFSLRNAEHERAKGRGQSARSAVSPQRQGQG